MNWIKLLKAIGICLIAAAIVTLIAMCVILAIELKIAVEAMIGVIFVVCVALVYGYLK